MIRRNALIAGVATAGGLAGAGTAWWYLRPADRGAGVDIWSMQFKRPDGAGLRLADFRGRPMLLNFWAPWCPPCVHELPLLDRFHQEQAAQGWRVVGLAVDNLAPVVEFLRLNVVSFPIGLAGYEGADLARKLGNGIGALPFSVVFDRSGNAFDRKLGIIKADDLLSWTHRSG